MSNFIKLPNGDYVNLALIERVQFTDDDNPKVAEIYFMGDVVHYRCDDADYLKNYLDSVKANNDEFILIHEKDQAAQTIGLGYAVEMISELSNKSVDLVAEHIQAVANQKVLKLSPDQIKAIRNDYEQNQGKGQAGSLGFIELA